MRIFPLLILAALLFPCAVATADPAKGPLRVLKANPRYFTDGSGKAVYLTGSHTWANQQDHGVQNPPPVFDFNAYLDFLQKHHHNFIRLRRKELTRYSFANFQNGAIMYVAGPQPWPRTGPGLALDGKPRFDLSKFDPAFFDRLRSRIIAARDRGIYVSVMFFDGHGVADAQKPWCWDGHPFNLMNNINTLDGDADKDGLGRDINTLHVPAVTALQEAYIRKTVDTVNDLNNVLYEVSNESETYPGSLEWENWVVNFVKRYEAGKPKQHPVGITFLLGGKNADLFAGPADWISPNHTSTPNWDYRTNPLPADGSKVVVADTDHLGGEWGRRDWVWRSFTRGLNTLYMDRIVEIDRGDLRPDVPEAENVRLNMGYSRLYADRMNLAAMTPQSNLASSGYCLANTFSKPAEYLVYLPEKPEVTVDLSPIPANFSVEWLNPANGEVVKAKPVRGGSKLTLSSPFPNDSVLYLSQTTP
jgi:hypothetical protein